MAEDTLTAVVYFEGRARKYNHYAESEAQPGQSCATCIRRRFSHPYTCNDGWPLHAPWVNGCSTWEDRGASCLNWSDDPKCPVD